jgi:CheY-like chemotaxis protein
MRASLPSTINIVQNIEGDVGLIEGDPIHIYQILINLCTNAVHAMREKGDILEVSLSKINRGDAEMQHPGLPPGSYVRLTVSDNGPGMTSAVLGRIFDPYFTTKEKGEGTGLGLAVVHGIVKSHGGIITVYSEPGKGTTFHVYFPRLEGEVPKELEAAKPIATGKERILFVDDEEAILDMGKKILERLGYEVSISKSGTEALELFRAQPDRFDLLITDMTMPNMTGEILATKLLEIRPDVPIILCSGFSEQIGEEKARAFGIRAFLLKPVIGDQLATTIRQVLDQQKK